MKKINANKLKFNILLCSPNTGEPMFFNIFDNIVVREDIVKCLKKKPTREELKETLDKVCQYQFWSRYQYEIEVREYMSKKDAKRVDGYEQVKANIDVIVDYLMTFVEKN